MNMYLFKVTDIYKFYIKMKFFYLKYFQLSKVSKKLHAKLIRRS